MLPRLALLAALGIAIALAILFRERIDAVAIQAWVVAVGPAGPQIFILVYALAAVLFVLGSVLTVAGCALFGPLLSTLINLTGATLGAALAFLISRYLAADWMRRRLGARTQRFIGGVESEGWRFVALPRLVLIFLFNPLNHALGLTRSPFLQSVLAAAICMAPVALTFTWVGFAGRAEVPGGQGLIQTGLIALGLVAVVAFLPRLLVRSSRRSLLAPSALAAIGAPSDMPPPGKGQPEIALSYRSMSGMMDASFSQQRSGFAARDSV
jgi:uncharacterized membrane protein YdjX (TVP38/TMEM64 family)